jgi:cyclic-di-GMP phosphodiesterase TipF (flagellum assembly factor)
MRLGGIFIALCMLIIAGSAGAIVYLYFELGHLQAAAAAAVTLIALILYSLISGRIGFRSVVDRQLTDLARGSADVARQVAEMGRRLAALEGKLDTALDQTRALTDPLSPGWTRCNATSRALGMRSRLWQQRSPPPMRRNCMTR